MSPPPSDSPALISQLLTLLCAFVLQLKLKAARKTRKSGGKGAWQLAIMGSLSLSTLRAAFNYARVRCNEANCFLLSIKVKFSL